MNEIDIKIYDAIKQNLAFNFSLYQDRIDKEMQILSDANLLKQLYKFYLDVKKNISKIGRENKCQSFVAYGLGITSAKPDGPFKIEKRRTYARSGWPDIDMDFDHERRHEIIEYLYTKYNKDCVANIGTTQSLKIKSTVRRVIKALDPSNTIRFDKKGKQIKVEDNINFALENRILKTLPELMKKSDGTFIKTVKEAYEEYADFRREMDAYPEVYRVSRRIENRISGAGSHAGGWVLSSEPLNKICPLHATTGAAAAGDKYKKNAKVVATQFSMNDVESLGLIKFDILGIATKTAMSLAKQFIFERHGVELDLSNLPLDDKITLDLLNSGYTDGIFQLESNGMKHTLQQIGIDSFDDLVLAIAMFRPGPMDYIPELANRKRNPSSVKYIHPIIKKHTKNTWGIVAYQEQAMRIFVDLAELTTTQGYIFIKGAAKKKPELFQSMKNDFIKGVTKNATREIAEAVWKQLEPFQGYAFNLSLSHDTKIATLEKDISIQELYNRKCRGEKLPKVYSPSGNPIKILDVYDHGVLPVWEIKFSDGNTHKCTLNHKFQTPLGIFPLHEIIRRNLSVIQNRGVINAKVQGLDLSRLPKNLDQPSIISNSQEELFCASTQQKELCLSGLQPEIYSHGVFKTQKSLQPLEESKVSTLFGVKRKDFEEILGRNKTRQKKDGQIQKENVTVGFIGNFVQQLRKKTTVSVNEKSQYSSQNSFSEKQNRDGYKNISTPGNTKTESASIKEMERRQSERLYCKMHHAINDTGWMAIVSRKIFEKNVVAYWVPEFSNYKKQKFQFAIQKKTNRFYGQKKPSSCRIRWTAPFSRLFKKLVSDRKSTERPGSQCSIVHMGIFGNSYFLRHLASQQMPIQNFAASEAAANSSLLPRARSGQNNWKEVRIVEANYVGYDQCYDLEVDSPDHLYCLSSGIVNSNSHAVSYAYESYKTAYLKAHYDIEFIAAKLSVETKRRNFDDIAKYESDAIKNRHIKILPPDLNDSKMTYKITGEREIRRSILIKGIGVKAAEDIVFHQPYKGNDILYSFASKVGSAVNTKVVETMCEAGLWGEESKKGKTKERLLLNFEQIKKDKRDNKGRPSGDMFE